MHPLDRLATVLGNSDADARGVSFERPAAGLSDVVRIGWGPEVPALLCNNDSRCQKSIGMVADIQDPLCRLPNWDDYAPWLSNSIADLNNIVTMPQFGAIVAALFLRRFISPETLSTDGDFNAWVDRSFAPFGRYDRRQCCSLTQTQIEGNKLQPDVTPATLVTLLASTLKEITDITVQ
jgi:hypothetical protein